MNQLKQFGIIPVDYMALATILNDYKSLKDKIANMEKSGDLIRLKKGLFVASPELTGQLLSRELIANHLYGPSYVSLESALAFYGLIPERVYAVRSVTFKRAKHFSTPLGYFDYVTVPQDYFPNGIHLEVIDKEYAFLIASPEKTLCDMIVLTRNLRIQSVKSMLTYLEEDLRIDFSAIKTFDKEIIRQCINNGKKQTELIQLLKSIDKIQTK